MIMVCLLPHDDYGVWIRGGRPVIELPLLGVVCCSGLLHFLCGDVVDYGFCNEDYDCGCGETVIEGNQGDDDVGRQKHDYADDEEPVEETVHAVLVMILVVTDFLEGADGDGQHEIDEAVQDEEYAGYENEFQHCYGLSRLFCFCLYLKYSMRQVTRNPACRILSIVQLRYLASAGCGTSQSSSGSLRMYSLAATYNRIARILRNGRMLPRIVSNPTPTALTVSFD